MHGFPNTAYEMPVAGRFLQVAGADIVGMSTVHDEGSRDEGGRDE